MRQAAIIAIGSELTNGITVDTNSPWLARALAGLGIRTQEHRTVPDEHAAIREAVRAAAARSDVVLVSGGLGPTADDLTRAALADAAGVELELHGPTLAQIHAYFARRRRDMPERNRVQALLPRGATPLENPQGTAAGIHLLLSGTPVYAMPGVPFELERMFEDRVAPALRAGHAGAVMRFRTLHTAGLGESDVGARLEDLMARGRNPDVGTTAAEGLVSVRLSATGPDLPGAEHLLDAAEAEIRARLGEVVFGRDGQTLAGVVGERLAARGETLALAESCTGGLIGKLVTDVSGSSRYFLGGAVTYANETKHRLLDVPRAALRRHGAVSPPVAEAMAQGVRAALGSTHGVSVTGVAGPGGGTTEKPVGLVYIGLAHPARTTVHEIFFGSDSPRALIRLRSAYVALNLLRLELLGS